MNEDKVLEMYQQLNLHEKLRMMELLCYHDVAIFLHSEKHDIGFTIDDARDEGFFPTLNGGIQFNIELNKARANCSRNIERWGNWDTTLESFLKPIAKKKAKTKGEEVK